MAPGISIDGGRLFVRPPVADAPELKELGARKTSDNGGGYIVAPTSLNVLRLAELYGDAFIDTAPADVQALAREQWGFARFTDDERAQAEQHPSWDQLYDFQREGVEYLFCNPHGAGMCSLSWGLGKAAINVVAADMLDARRVLVLAPLTLAPAWVGEFQRWSAHDRDIKRATAKDRAPGPGVTIANHEVLQEVVLKDEDGEIVQPDWATNARRVKQWIGEGPMTINKKGKRVPARERIARLRRDYRDADWDLVIADESVVLKNRKALKTDVLMALRKAGDPFMFLMSASPTTKYRNDLWRQMQIMFPRGFTSYWRFTEFFCIVDKGGWGWTIEGDRPDRDPHHYLRDMMWVKSEDEAGLQLPEYHESVVPAEPGRQQREALDSMINDWVVELDDAPGEPVVAANWLARSTRLQQITSNLGSLPRKDGEGFHKRASIKEDILIEMLVSGDLKPPLLVWSWFIETTRSIADRLDAETDLRVEYVHGELNTDVKDEGLRAYKEGDADALVLQMGTGKFGHTFTNTRGIYYHDRTMDGDAYTQSRRRVRRLGLKHRPTLIVPKIENSADDLIDANLDGKLRSVAQLTNADLADLLRSLKDPA